ANRGRIIAILDAEVRFEELDHGQVRGRLTVGERGRVQDEPALASMRLCDLPDEAGLADARLPDDRHDLAMTGRGPFQSAAKQLPLQIPTDERRHGTAWSQAQALEPLESIAL